MKVTVECTFDMAHRLYKYDGPCGNLHGHTYKVQCTWEGEPTETGMVRDFVNCKRAVENAVSEWDHTTLLYRDDPLVVALSNQTRVRTTAAQPTAEHMAYLLKQRLDCKEVKLWETPTSFVTI